MSWILTYTGKRIDFQAPDPTQICLEDIAHALSNLCRFTGHTRTFYSVAQHSVMVADIVPGELALPALLHDATEAYCADLSSPLKNLLPEYQKIEQRLWRAIALHFGLPLKMAAEIKHADLRLLATERRDLLPPDTEEWEILRGVSPLQYQIRPWDPREAAQFFIAAFENARGYEDERTDQALG